jgi:hypothetical protein
MARDVSNFNPAEAVFRPGGPAMNDMEKRLEKLLNDAEECALISKLATDPEKRELFARLAEHWKASAAEVERVIAAKLARSSGERSNCLTK